MSFGLHFPISISHAGHCRNQFPFIPSIKFNLKIPRRIETQLNNSVKFFVPLVVFFSALKAKNNTKFQVLEIRGGRALAMIARKRERRRSVEKGERGKEKTIVEHLSHESAREGYVRFPISKIRNTPSWR